MKNIFQASEESPFHISIGVVLTNEKGEICCHFYKKNDVPIETEKRTDLYILLRETILPNETLEGAVSRGLKEEFGAEGTIKRYLGSTQTHFPLRVSKVDVEKTTLYFHVEKSKFDPKSREDDGIESRSEIRWLDPKEVLRLTKKQGKEYDRSDLDESKIIEGYIKYAGN